MLSERQLEAARDLASARTAIDERFRQMQDRVDELQAQLREETAYLLVFGQTPNPDGVIQRCPVAGPTLLHRLVRMATGEGIRIRGSTSWRRTRAGRSRARGRRLE